MATLELVVARYDEDLAWLRRVPPTIRIALYDKSGPASEAAHLPNVGREAHTYLHHIVTRYDTLADVTVFSQGKPFDHVPDFHRQLRRLAAGTELVSDFRWMGFIIDWDDAAGARLFRHWSKNEDGHVLDMHGFWQALWDEPIPERFMFYPGAHFMVTAKQLRAQPRNFYERAMAVAEAHPDGAHCFERCWDRVFRVDGIPEELRQRECPMYLRPVRRLGLTWEDVPPAHRGWSDD